MKPVGKETNIRKGCEMTDVYRDCEGRRICGRLERMNNMKIL
jgi:hypothetical protein